MKPNINDLKPGDIILSRSGTFLSRSIRFFGKLQTKNARVSHSALYIGGGQVIESLWQVRVNDFSKYKSSPIVIYRLKGHTDEQRENVRREVLKVAGDNYAWWKIPLFMLDGFSSFIVRKPIYFFSSKIGVSSFRVCSQLVAWVWQKYGGHEWMLDWRAYSPDILDDHFKGLTWNKCTCVPTKIYENIP